RSVGGARPASWPVARAGRPSTFRLRRGVKFHDGAEFTSRDAKATYDKIAFPPLGVASELKGAYVNVEAIEAPDPYTLVFRLKWPRLVPLVAGLAVELDLQGRHSCQGHALVRDARDGHGPVRVRGACEGLPLGREAEPELLGQGEALPRRLPGALHQGLRGPGGGDPRRASAHPVPRLLARRARQPRGRPRPEDHGPGEPLALRPARHHEPREEPLR